MSQILSTLRAFSSQVLRARLLFVAFGAVLLFSGMAHASLIAVLTSGPTDIGFNQYAYTYRIDVTNDERVDPAATNGVTCPSPTFQNIQCDPTGTFLTLYDIPGFITAFTTAPNFVVTSANLGMTPSTINSLSIDDPNVINVTFTYNGAVVNGPFSFGDFTVVSQFSGLNPNGNFSSQATKNAGPASGQTDQLTSSVPLPMRPTAAATASLSGRVLASNGRGIRGVRMTLMSAEGGETKVTATDKFGQYNFTNVEVGVTYIITAVGKNYFFSQNTQVQTVLDDAPDINFYAVPR